MERDHPGCGDKRLFERQDREVDNGEPYRPLHHDDSGLRAGKRFLGNLCRVLGVPEELEVVFRETSQPVMVGPDRQRRVWLITAAQQ